MPPDGDDKCTYEVGGGGWVASGRELLEDQAVLYSSFIPATAHNVWGIAGMLYFVLNKQNISSELLLVPL